MQLKSTIITNAVQQYNRYSIKNSSIFILTHLVSDLLYYHIVYRARLRSYKATMFFYKNITNLLLFVSEVNNGSSTELLYLNRHLFLYHCVQYSVTKQCVFLDFYHMFSTLTIIPTNMNSIISHPNFE